MNYKCLSIAGFDGSGGAGLQADLKTFSALGCYGMTVLTALPVQNTCGVKHCYDIPLDSIQAQLETIFADITPDSIKIGMLFSASIITQVATFLAKHASNIPIVLDPVMIAKSGDRLLLPDAIDCLKQQLIPLTSIITPNLPEAYSLVGKHDEIETMATQLLDLGTQAVLVKGGHQQTTHSNDLFVDQQGNSKWFTAKRIESNNTHGTGCTLSAAIAALIARGYSIATACQLAKTYLFHAIQAAKDSSVGHGHGPVAHFYHLWPIVDELIQEMN